MSFFKLDLGLDLDTQTDLDMVKMYLYTRNEISSCSSSKVIA